MQTDCVLCTTQLKCTTKCSVMRAKWSNLSYHIFFYSIWLAILLLLKNIFTLFSFASLCCCCCCCPFSIMCVCSYVLYSSHISSYCINDCNAFSSLCCIYIAVAFQLRHSSSLVCFSFSFALVISSLFWCVCLRSLVFFLLHLFEIKWFCCCCFWFLYKQQKSNPIIFCSFFFLVFFFFLLISFHFILTNILLLSFYYLYRIQFLIFFVIRFVALQFSFVFFFFCVPAVKRNKMRRKEKIREAKRIWTNSSFGLLRFKRKCFISF